MQDKDKKFNQLSPEIRFRGFSEDWEEKKLIDVANYRNGRAHENSIDEKGKYTVVNSKFVSTNGEVKKFSNEQLEPLLKDEIAFVLSDVPNGRAIARTFLVSKDSLYTLNQRIAGITPILGNCPYYLYILLNRNPYFLSFDDGAKQTNLAKSDVESFTGLYPNVKEQSKIGDFFQKIDRLISQHQQKHDKLLNIKKPLLEKMFPQPGKTEPEIRFKSFSEKWKVSNLKDLAEFNPKAELPENFKYVDLESVLGTEMVSYRMESRISAPSRAQRLARKGDVFYQTVRPYQKNNYLFIKSDDDFVFSTGYAQMRPFEDSYFLLTLVQNSRFVKQVLDNCTGTSYPAINSKDLSCLETSFPDVKEQTKIGNLFQQLDRLISQHQTQIQKLNHLKQAFLSKMFL